MSAAISFPQQPHREAKIYPLGGAPSVGITGLRLWILVSAYLNLLGWALAFSGHLDLIGYTVGGLIGGALLILWLGWEFLNYWVWWEWRGWVTEPPSLRFGGRRWRRGLPRAFAVLFFLVATGAAVHVPNNYDALTYRIPQILHWVFEHRWIWISASDNLLNISSPGYGWLMAPSIVFFHTDRLFAVPNVVAFALLPGAFFSAARACGVAGRVAWNWMWTVPAISCFATQAGSIGNDLLPAVYVLVGFALAMRARRTKSWLDFCISALAVALATGVKITVLPLVLPWVVASFPSWRMFRQNRLSGIVAASAAILISYFPTAVLNYRFTGSWNGDPDNHYNVQISAPAQGVAGNSLMILIGALEPPICPAVKKINEQFEDFRSTVFTRWIVTKFPRFKLSFGEMATEEGAGIGLAIFLLLLLSTIVALSHKRRIVNPMNRYAIFAAIIIAFFAFLAKMGSEASARLAAPYYSFVIIIVLAFSGQDWNTRQRWWQTLAVLAVISIFPAVILSPARPLFPAQSAVNFLVRYFPNNHWLERARLVYDGYAHRDDYLAPLKAELPKGVSNVGVIPTTNDLEGSFWKPYGSWRITEVLTKSPQDPALARLRGSAIITSQRALGERFNLTPEAYAARIGGKISARTMLAQKVGLGAEEWVLITLPKLAESKKPDNLSSERNETP